MATRTRDLGGDKERNQENCNSRVELFFPVMLNLSPRRMDLFFMYGEKWRVNGETVYTTASASSLASFRFGKSNTLSELHEAKCHIQKTDKKITLDTKDFAGGGSWFRLPSRGCFDFQLICFN